MLLLLGCQLLHTVVMCMDLDVEVVEVGIQIILDTDFVGGKPWFPRQLVIEFRRWVTVMI